MKKSSMVTVLGILFLLSAFAPVGNEQRPKVKYQFKGYLACSLSDSQQVDKLVFDQLILKPLCAKDSAGNQLKVESFNITWAERGLYQDSTGLPIIYTDYTVGSFNGDAIPTDWTESFRDRSYKGDTVYFDRIMVKTPDNKSQLCKPLKIEIR